MGKADSPVKAEPSPDIVDTDTAPEKVAVVACKSPVKLVTLKFLGQRQTP